MEEVFFFAYKVIVVFPLTGNVLGVKATAFDSEHVDGKEALTTVNAVTTSKKMTTLYYVPSHFFASCAEIDNSNCTI